MRTPETSRRISRTTPLFGLLIFVLAFGGLSISPRALHAQAPVLIPAQASPPPATAEPPPPAAAPRGGGDREGAGGAGAGGNREGRGGGGEGGGGG